MISKQHPRIQSQILIPWRNDGTRCKMTSRVDLLCKHQQLLPTHFVTNSGKSWKITMKWMEHHELKPFPCGKTLRDSTSQIRLCLSQHFNQLPLCLKRLTTVGFFNRWRIHSIRCDRWSDSPTLSIFTFGSRCVRWQNSQFCPCRQLP